MCKQLFPFFEKETPSVGKIENLLSQYNFYRSAICHNLFLLKFPFLFGRIYRRNKSGRLEVRVSVDIKLNVAKLIAFVYDREENSVGKGENAGNQHFLLFLQSFLPFPVQFSLFQPHLFFCLQINALKLDCSRILLFGKGLSNILMYSHTC